MAVEFKGNWDHADYVYLKGENCVADVLKSVCKLDYHLKFKNKAKMVKIFWNFFNHFNE